MTATTDTVNRVVWAMPEATGEFGEVPQGTEGTVIERQQDGNGPVRYLAIEWDTGVMTVEDAWQVDYVS